MTALPRIDEEANEILESYNEEDDKRKTKVSTLSHAVNLFRMTSGSDELGQKKAAPLT